MSTDSLSLAPEVAVPWWKSVVTLVLLGLTLVLCYCLSPATATPEAGVDLQLPPYLLGLPGHEKPVSKAELQLLPKDTQFAKSSYGALDGRDLTCQIVLGGVDRRSIHRPEVCLPGQGWTIKSTDVIPIPLKSGHDLRVTKLSLTTPVRVGGHTESLKMLYLYWFVSREFSTPSNFHRIVSDSWDMLFHNRLHRWAYVIVEAPVLDNLVAGARSEDEVVARMKKAIAELAPQIMYAEGATKSKP